MSAPEFLALLGVGFPWLLMSDGIGKRSRPAFFCVILIHGLTVAWAAANASIEILGPLVPSVDAFGKPISPTGWLARVVGFGLWMGVVAFFAWSIRQLLRPDRQDSSRRRPFL